MKPAKIFKTAIDTAPTTQAPGGQQQRPPNPTPRSITGITFDDRGDQVVTAGEDETFRVYNCKTGKQVLTATLPVLNHINHSEIGSRRPSIQRSTA
jgi:COMPASS component SWD2